ncbi:MAG TPA: adenylate/guanylate cyclase domain-containing protein [Terriglobia bacterium]|nr:adenylate/guanylate cyclase domain-containing protein [Terriglobia bacterium]
MSTRIIPRFLRIMERDKLQELLETRAQADQELERMRASVTILFSDIQGSTTYFERKGDVEGLAMVERHHALLEPVIERSGGRVVKTIGDAIMASFVSPVGAVKAAIGMQRALEADRVGRPEEEQTHIRVGLHTGLGLVKSDDVYGDVVNTASRVQHQAQPDQILITDVLLDAARDAGAQCVRLGRAEMKGKDEPLDVYAVAWSAAATEQLMDELRAQLDAKVKEMRRQYDRAESEFESSRSQWRMERRSLHEDIERLENAVEQAREEAKAEVLAELHAELQYQLDEALQSRRQLEEEYGAAQLKWDEERRALRAQMVDLQGSVIEAMERANNPTRLALAVREQVEARLEQAKREWRLEADSERRRLNAEIDRLRKAGNADAKKDAARAALLQKLGKAPSASKSRTPEEWERELHEGRMKWATERDQLTLQIERLERSIQGAKDEVRSEVFQELRAQYEPRLNEANRDRERLAQEMISRSDEFEAERQRLSQRIAALEQTLPEAREAARRQAAAELKTEFETKVDELMRLRARADRRLQDQSDEAESDRRRYTRQIAQLEGQLKEAREDVFRAQRASAGSEWESDEDGLGVQRATAGSNSDSNS